LYTIFVRWFFDAWWYDIAAIVNQCHKMSASVC
jgi:hypothetical protein